MAGVKGRSGGARVGTGGPQPGSGRPRKPVAAVDKRNVLEFLLDTMQGIIDPTEKQLKAAIAALPFKHVKRVDGGKKDEQLEKAREVASGRLSTAEPPKLVSSR